MTKKKRAVRDEHPSNGKDEMNLAEFPFAVLGKQDKRKVLAYEGWLGKDGKRQQITWTASTTVTGEGLPTEFGVRVFLAVLKEAEQQGWPELTEITLYRILKNLELPDTKQYYAAVKRELERLTRVTIICNKAFWDNEEKKRVSTDAFHLLDEYHFAWLGEEEKNTEVEKESYIRIGRRILKSIQSGYIKNIDFIFYNRLTKPISRQLYRLLDKQMHYRTTFEIDIFELAARLGLRPYKYPSNVMQKLQPAIDELIESGFLREAGTKKVGKYTRAWFVKGDGIIEQSTEDEEGLQEPSKEAPTWVSPWDKALESITIPDELNTLWQEVLKEFEAMVPHPTFSTFLKNTALTSLEDGTAVVLVANTYARDWMGARLSKRVRDEVNRVLKKRGLEEIESVRFEVCESAPAVN